MQHLHVCMYGYMRIYIMGSKHTYKHTCRTVDAASTGSRLRTCVYVWIYAYIHNGVETHIQTHLQKSGCSIYWFPFLSFEFRVWIQIYTYLRTCVYVWIYAYIHNGVETHIQTHLQHSGCSRVPGFDPITPPCAQQ